MRTFVVVTGLVVCGVAIAADQQASAPATRFALTVDSIMRGPALVGYPPSDLRWSGDSKELYFEWRMPGEDEAGDLGRRPRRRRSRAGCPTTSGAARRSPTAAGTPTRRRILGVDRGDIVVIDTVGRTRRDITRTTGNETQPALGARRHARHVRARQQPVHRAGRRRVERARWCS